MKIIKFEQFCDCVDGIVEFTQYGTCDQMPKGKCNKCGQLWYYRFLYNGWSKMTKFYEKDVVYFP